MSTTPILVDDFTSFPISNTPPNPPTYNTFIYFQFPEYNFVANDGNVLSGPQGTTIGSVPYTLTINNGLDHVKWLALRSKPFTLPDTGELITQTLISGRQINVENNPFPKDLVPNPHADPRLSMVGPTNISYVSYRSLTIFLTSDILITNDVIYGIYEILPFAKPSYDPSNTTIDYASFTALIPIGDKRDMDPRTGEFIAATAYNKTAGYYRFIINGEERFRVTNLGHYPDPKYIVINHGGPPTNLTIDNVQTGYGLFTLLDGAISCPNLNCTLPALVRLDPATDYFNPCNNSIPEVFYDSIDQKSNRIFGQGGILNLRQQTVYLSSITPPPLAIYPTFLGACPVSKHIEVEEEGIPEKLNNCTVANISLQAMDNNTGRILSIPLRDIVYSIISMSK